MPVDPNTPEATPSAAVAAPTYTVGQRTARSGLWLALQVIGTKLILTATSVILGWLLLREEYGQVGLVQTVTAFVTLFMTPGIDTVLIQRHEQLRRWVTPAFWMSLALGTLGGLLLLGVAPLAAWFYGNAEIQGIISIFAISAPLGALITVPRAILTAEMRFRQIAMVTLGGVCITGVLTIIGALLGWGAYSLFVPVPVTQLCMAIWYWRLVKPNIRLRPYFSRWRYLIGDSSLMLVTRVLVIAVSQGDYFILGALYNEKIVGIYTFGFGIAVQGLRLVAGSLSNTLFPAFTQLANDPPRQVAGALKAARLICFVSVPICFLQAATAAPVMNLLYGDKWDSAVFIIQVLSLALAIDAPSWVGGALLQAQRRLKLLFQISLVCTIIFFLAIWLGAELDAANGTAVAVACYYGFLAPVVFYFATRPSGVTWRDLLGVYARPLVAALCSFGLALLIAQLIPGEDKLADLLRFMLISAVGGGGYLAICYWIAPDLVGSFLQRLKESLRLKRFAKPAGESSS